MHRNMTLMIIADSVVEDLPRHKGASKALSLWGSCVGGPSQELAHLPRRCIRAGYWGPPKGLDKFSVCHSRRSAAAPIANLGSWCRSCQEILPS